MKSLSLLFLVLIALFSFCGENDSRNGPLSTGVSPANPEDSLFHEVLKGHDEGMAKIGRLKKYSSRLKTVIDSINKNPRADKSTLTSLVAVKDSLDAANASMFSWMDGFTADTLTGMTAERIHYLELQKISVEIVRDRINNSLELYKSVPKRYKIE